MKKALAKSSAGRSCKTRNSEFTRSGTKCRTGNSNVLQQQAKFGNVLPLNNEKNENIKVFAKSINKF